MSTGNWGARVLWTAGIVTALAVAAGIWIIDSPVQERLKRLDEARTQQLRMLDIAARAYWKEHDALPPDIATLASRPGAEQVVHDVDGGPDYRYRPLDATHFELCARFATNSADNRGLRLATIADEWAHPVGDHCFRRTLDDKDPG
jgi:hypothetical protein